MGANGSASGDEEGHDPPTDEVLAGEYILGVLDPAQRRAVQVRIAADPVFVRLVAKLEQGLGPLRAGIAPVKVPPHVWERIRARLGWTTPAMRGSLWQSRGLRRAATVLAAEAAILAVLLERLPQRIPQEATAAFQPTSAPVTTLAYKGGTLRWLGSIDVARGTMLVLPVPHPPDARGRVPELWLIPHGKAPRPLGLLSSERSLAITVPRGLRSALRSGSRLAVSLEPPGGAPYGVPTGPTIAKGVIQL